ncbi:MAG: hypothetical protein ACI4XM_00150 [Candidatus Coprovivens sp.]
MKEEEKLKPIKDLEFVFTEDMKENVFEMLTLQQLLDNQELSKRERKLIEKQKQKLFNKFRTRLQELNPTQTLIVRQFLNIK